MLLSLLPFGISRIRSYIPSDCCNFQQMVFDEGLIQDRQERTELHHALSNYMHAPEENYLTYSQIFWMVSRYPAFAKGSDVSAWPGHFP